MQVRGLEESSTTRQNHDASGGRYGGIGGGGCWWLVDVGLLHTTMDRFVAKQPRNDHSLERNTTWHGPVLTLLNFF